MTIRDYGPMPASLEPYYDWRLVMAGRGYLKLGPVSFAWFWWKRPYFDICCLNRYTVHVLGIPA